jgi:tetratricopeptide (TPR) repeat protein
MLGVPKWITYVAEGYLQAGDAARANNLLDEAWQSMDEWHNDYFRAEWLRIRAATLASVGQADEAEQIYRQSIELARRQEASLFELTASIGLAQLQGSSAASDLMTPLRQVLDEFRHCSAFGHLIRAQSLYAATA